MRRGTVRRTASLLLAAGAVGFAGLSAGCSDVQPDETANLSTPGPPLPSWPASPPANPPSMANMPAPSLSPLTEAP